MGNKNSAIAIRSIQENSHVSNKTQGVLGNIKELRETINENRDAVFRSAANLLIDLSSFDLAGIKDIPIGFDEEVTVIIDFDLIKLEEAGIESFFKWLTQVKLNLRIIYHLKRVKEQEEQQQLFMKLLQDDYKIQRLGVLVKGELDTSWRRLQPLVLECCKGLLESTTIPHFVLDVPSINYTRRVWRELIEMFADESYRKETLLLRTRVLETVHPSLLTLMGCFNSSAILDVQTPLNFQGFKALEVKHMTIVITESDMDINRVRYLWKEKTLEVSVGFGNFATKLRDTTILKDIITIKIEYPGSDHRALQVAEALNRKISSFPKLCEVKCNTRYESIVGDGMVQIMQNKLRLKRAKFILESNAVTLNKRFKVFVTGSCEVGKQMLYARLKGSFSSTSVATFQRLAGATRVNGVRSGRVSRKYQNDICAQFHSEQSSCVKNLVKKYDLEHTFTNRTTEDYFSGLTTWCTKKSISLDHAMRLYLSEGPFIIFCFKRISTKPRQVDKQLLKSWLDYFSWLGTPVQILFVCYFPTLKIGLSKQLFQLNNRWLEGCLKNYSDNEQIKVVPNVNGLMYYPIVDASYKVGEVNRNSFFSIQMLHVLIESSQQRSLWNNPSVNVSPNGIRVPYGWFPFISILKHDAEATLTYKELFLRAAKVNIPGFQVYQMMRILARTGVILNFPEFEVIVLKVDLFNQVMCYLFVNLVNINWDVERKLYIERGILTGSYLKALLRRMPLGTNPSIPKAIPSLVLELCKEHNLLCQVAKHNLKLGLDNSFISNNSFWIVPSMIKTVTKGFRTKQSKYLKGFITFPKLVPLGLFSFFTCCLFRAIHDVCNSTIKLVSASSNLIILEISKQRAFIKKQTEEIYHIAIFSGLIDAAKLFKRLLIEATILLKGIESVVEFLPNTPVEVEDQGLVHEYIFKYDCYLSFISQAMLTVEIDSYLIARELQNNLNETGFLLNDSNTTKKIESSLVISRSRVFIVLLTADYIDSVNSGVSKTAEEYNCAVKYGLERIVYVILEKSLLNPENWVGIVGRYYRDAFCVDFTSIAAREQNLELLTEKIKGTL